MPANTLCMSRLRDTSFSTKTVYSHAMSFDMLLPTTYGFGDSCTRMLGCPIVVVQGTSVPIFRGGPPIFYE